MSSPWLSQAAARYAKGENGLDLGSGVLNHGVDVLRIEIDGRVPAVEELWSTTSGFGHFTAMQVRRSKTRGLELHLRRLEMANGELFGAGLDRERVRSFIRHALGEIENASVRVYGFESDAGPRLMVTVKPPGGVASPQRLQSVRYQRPAAHLKHLATEQGFHSRAAHRNGFDDALLTGLDGTISETAIANIGFFDSSGAVWPDAPLLRGITMQLLEERVPYRRAHVGLGDIAGFEGAFLSNARGVAAVSEIDGITLPLPAARVEDLRKAYESVSWDAI
jgi:branched-subunit amino acid aminotransferase/4-amino-4-deoxychorismate lyase